MTDEVEPHVLRRFDVCQKLGRGAYGIVWKAIDKRSRKVLALKKCFEAFRNSTDAQRTFREVMYLQALSGHDNIVRLQHVVKAENGNDIYLTFDFMETDLHAVIRANILTDIHKKYIVYQVLKAIKFMHSAELLHRDIKPSNLLLNSDCHVKLCDFGLCRSVAEAHNTGSNTVLTDYVATRWYRSPEVLLGSTKYTKGIDLWSVGCILGEMLCHRPLLPGNSTMNQIERILELTGRPSKEDTQSMQSPFAITMIENISIYERISLSDLCNSATPEALDLMNQCLKFNPTKRCSAEAALRHPYVAEFHNSAYEPNYPYGPVKIDIDDSTKLSADEYRERLYEEIKIRRDESRRKQREKVSKRGTLAAARAIPEEDHIG
mmetsp:Transcript_4362/g.6339  ORF Transcript_4362/g.6339 Transcript_4362/m.6339 type:complete len:377 (-) Transcript_4362:719-1849(-)